jgi:hypothetical protein
VIARLFQTARQPAHDELEVTWCARDFALQSMPFAEYRAIDAVNWSSLREMRKGPSAYRYRLDHPREDTTRLGFGRGAHAALFEPDRFALEFAVYTGARRAGKAWKAFEAVHAGRTILKAGEYARCIAMRDAVRAHGEAARHLRTGHSERAIVWTDTETGLRCKARIDHLGDELLVDLKTTDDVTRFGWFAEQLGYHSQLAFYRRGLRALGIDVPARIVAVECKPPHRVELVALAAARLEAGERECARLLRLVAACRSSKTWRQS